MTLLVENANVSQRGIGILSLLGSFWRELHGDAVLTEQYGKGLGEYLAQRYMSYLEYVESLSRRTVPVWRTTQWFRLSILESEMEASEAGMLRYGQDDLVYGVSADGITIHLYGGQVDNSYEQVDTDETLRHVAVLTDTPVAASMCLVCGTDYWIDTDYNAIVFRTNPFDLPEAPVTTIYDDDGVQSDRQLTLWGFKRFDDMSDISNRYGVVVGLESRSTANFRRLVNAMIDSMVDGPTMSAMVAFLCAYAGIRPVQSDGEVVTEITRTSSQLVIATDSDVYTFHRDATEVVSVGDTVYKDDILANVVQIMANQREFESLEGFMLDKNLCRVCDEPIAVPNEDSILSLTTYQGKTKVSVGLYGDPSVRRAFWNAVHATGVAEDFTLANYLDLRTDPLTEPTRSDLPTTVNPFRLILHDMLGEIMFVVIRPELFSENAPTIPFSATLGKFVPARSACVTLIEASQQIEYHKLNSPADDENAGATDEVESHIGAVVSDDSVSFVDTQPGSPAVSAFYLDADPEAWTTDAPCG